MGGSGGAVGGAAVVEADAGEADAAVAEAAEVDGVVREVTLQPGGTTGWHYHPGPLVVVVESGTLTRTLADRTVRTSSAGQVFVEEAGRDHVHIGRNLGSDPVVLTVTYLVPAGSPLSVDAPAPDAV